MLQLAEHDNGSAGLYSLEPIMPARILEQPASISLRVAAAAAAANVSWLQLGSRSSASSAEKFSLSAEADG